MQYGGAYAFQPSTQSRHPLAAPGAATAVTLNCISCHDPHKQPVRRPAAPAGARRRHRQAGRCRREASPARQRVLLGVPRHEVERTREPRRARTTTRTAAATRRRRTSRLAASRRRRARGATRDTGRRATLNLVKGAGGRAPASAVTAGRRPWRRADRRGAHGSSRPGGTLSVDAALPCADCHDPHGSLRGNAQLLSDKLGRRTRHERRTRRRSGASASRATRPPRASAGTARARRTPRRRRAPRSRASLRAGGPAGSGPGGVGQNWLRLQAGDRAISSTDTSMSCYDCHGGDYSSASANNVHNPATYSAARHTAQAATATVSIAGTSYGPYACASCHDLELAPEHAKTGSSSAAPGARRATPTRVRRSTPSWNRTCTQGGCHTVASTAPMHGTIEGDHSLAPPGAVLGQRLPRRGDELGRRSTAPRRPPSPA